MIYNVRKYKYVNRQRFCYTVYSLVYSKFIINGPPRNFT